jgi:hypothetical protein
MEHIEHLEHVLKTVQFLLDGRPLEVKHVYNPLNIVQAGDQGKPVVELVARNWTLDEIAKIVGMCLPTLLPSHGIAYAQRRGGVKYFEGMTLQQIAEDFYEYWGNPKEIIRDLTKENIGKAFQIIGAEMPKDEFPEQPGDSRIAGSRSDSNNRYNPDA